MSEDQGKGPLALAKNVLYGLAFSSVIIAAFALIFLYLIPNLRSRDPGWQSVESDSIVIHYSRESFEPEAVRPLLAKLTETRKAVVGGLNLEPGAIPEKVHVYLHEDVNSLKSTITERKSSAESNNPLGLMDVIAGRDSERVLVRLLLTFAWGRPSSELLRLGLENYFADEYEEALTRAAALGDIGFTIPEIAGLARTTDYLKSFQDRIYDTFDSPGASAGLSLSTLARLTRLDEFERPYEYQIGVRAQSFIHFLLESTGVEACRSLWDADSLTRGTSDVLGSSLTEVEENWKNYLQNSTTRNPEYRYYRARALLGQGQLDRARSELAGPGESGSPRPNRSLLLGTIDFYSGNWKEARDVFTSLQSEKLSEAGARELERFSSLLSVYESGKSLSRENLKLFLPERSDELSRQSRTLFEIFEKKREKIPELKTNYPVMSVFLVEDSKTAAGWRKVDPPEWVTVLEVDAGLKLDFAEFLVASSTKTPTYSGLLRQGLVRYLATEEVFARGGKIVTEGDWTPLAGAVFQEGEGSTAPEIQAAAFVGYLIEQFGSAKFLKIWRMTTPIGGDNSLEYALLQTTGRGLDKTEAELKSFLASRRD